MGRATRWLKGLLGIKPSSSDHRRDPKRCSFGHVPDALCDSSETIPPNISAREAAWLRSYCVAALAETEKEQKSRQAIAMAAATAAAADAAVAAAKAAAAIVRLSSQGKRRVFAGGREKWAAVKIQCVFRSHLARKALRALRGVVKIQAMVRGYLVRKQAAATLRSMQALARAQAAVKLHRARQRHGESCSTACKFENKTRKSIRFGDARSEDAFSTQSRRFPVSVDNRTKNNNEETAAKIVEMDTGTRPGYSRIGKPATPLGSVLADDHVNRSFSSPLSSRIPAPLSMPKHDWDALTGKKFPTAQSTPRLVSSPSKSYCGGFFREFHPYYMGDTTSFRSKLRSHSAPRQRPETAAADAKRRTNEIAAAEAGWKRSVSGGLRMQSWSSSGAQEAVSFRDAVMGKLV